MGEKRCWFLPTAECLVFPAAGGGGSEAGGEGDRREVRRSPPRGVDLWGAGRIMGLQGGRGAGFLHAEASSVFRRGRMRSRRRRDGGDRGHAHLVDVSECGSYDTDSCDERSPYSDGNGMSGRKIILDDALFDFFSKQAIKTLKRDFSKFCRDSDIWIENKRPRVSGIGKDSFTVYSTKYFFEVLQRLTVGQKAVVEKWGFGCVFALSKTHIPSSFIRWLAWSVDPQCSQIIFNDKIINLSKDSIQYVLGLPNTGAILAEDSDASLEFIISLFHLSEVPNITFFGNKLISNEPLTDEEVFVCFMQVALCCFLCPSSNGRLDTKYIKKFGDLQLARSFDVCQLVYKHLINGIAKMINFIKAKGRKPKVFEFCSYALAVYYLDSLYFSVHVAGSGVPRAVSWRGDMIQVYSELDLASCYLNEADLSKSRGQNCELLSAQHRMTMHDKFGMTLSGQTIDGIFEIMESINSFPLDNSNKDESLAHNVLQYLADGRPWFKSSYFAGFVFIDIYKSQKSPSSSKAYACTHAKR